MVLLSILVKLLKSAFDLVRERIPRKRKVCGGRISEAENRVESKKMIDASRDQSDTREVQRLKARAYFQQAMNDAHAARMLADEERTRAQALFMVQQATEKFWKSHIYAMGEFAPKGHKTMKLVKALVRLEMEGFREFALRLREQHDEFAQRSGLVSRIVGRITTADMGEGVGKTEEAMNNVESVIIQQLDQINERPDETLRWTSPQIKLVLDTVLTLKYDAERFGNLFHWSLEDHEDLKTLYEEYSKVSRFLRWLTFISADYRLVVKTIHARVILIVMAAVTWPHAMASRYPDNYPEGYLRGDLEIGAIQEVALLAHHTYEALDLLSGSEYIENRIHSADMRSDRIAKRKSRIANG